MSTIEHPDGRVRCSWPGTDPLYVAYHDTDWGVPERDSRALFEKLVLDGFQAGLSWITILRKRENFRRAFDGFEPARVARYNRRKVESARAFLELSAKQDFSEFVWSFVDGRPVQNRWRVRGDVPAETDMSRKLSKALAEKGFKFCGPTIVYAFMQAVGMVNDHYVDCCRHGECAALAIPRRKKIW
jgi:DNA-3-methyladenine glycosylase I